MQFIYSEEGEVGVGALAASLAKVAMDLVRQETGGKVEARTVGQTDERYGPVGHPDSNWRQMLDAHFNFEGVRTLPILQNKPLQDTVAAYALVLADAFTAHDAVVAQFGIGADGHVAGMLPHTGGIESEELVFGYESAPFVRITMTPPAFLHIDAAYTFAFGEGKREAIHNLQTKELAAIDEPCQLLKKIPESYFYSDQIS